MFYRLEDTGFKPVKSATFHQPRGRFYGLRRAYSRGRASLGATGSDYTYVWVGEIVRGVGVRLYREDDPSISYDISIAGEITQFDFCFDQTMRPFVCYMVGGKSYYYHFDFYTDSYNAIELPADVSSPRCAIDVERADYAPQSDVLLFYSRAGGLYYRVQSERYNKERLIAADPKKSLVWRVGLTVDNRLCVQWR